MDGERVRVGSARTVEDFVESQDLSWTPRIFKAMGRKGILKGRKSEA